MREKKRGKRLLALLLACTLLVTSIPVQAAPVNAPEMTGGEETAEGLEVPAGTEEPAGTAEGEEVPAEPEPVLRKLEGTAVLTEAGAFLSGIPDIRIRFYEQETFDPESRENPVLAEAITEPDGTFALPELPEGVYRVAFQFLDPEQKAEDYQVIQPEKENGEEPKYQFAFPEEEEKEVLDCFAYIESYVVEEGSSLELKLEKKEAEITPEASPETTPEATPEVTPEADPETSPEVTPETTPEAEPEPTPETTPEAEPEPTPEADPETGVDEEAFWEAHNGLLPMAELAEQAEDQVYATVEKASTDRMAEGSAWTFDVYYVNQADDYYAEQFEDFNLKYQVEFHNSQDLEANAVEIRIPRKLFSDREGKEIVPTEIAVPEGTVEKPKPARTSPFNYYVDGEDLVFFNYEAIPSGSNAAFQVLYKKLILMDLVDETEWKLQPSIKVKVGGTTEERQTKALTGFLDSEVHLSSVTVTPYDDPNLNYTPGLYTKEQVQDYLEANPLPDKYEKNFDDYRYVVWQIDILGNANQAWSLYLKEMPAIQGSSTPGEIVGIARKNPYELGYTAELMTSGPYQGYYKLEEKVKSEEIRYTYNVVAAYPESACGTNTILTNTAEVKLVPFDGKDPDEMKSGKNQWAYADYRWIYEGNTIGIGKWTQHYEKEESQKGWLEVYKESRKKKIDQGDLEFHTGTIINGYGYTHYTEGSSLGERIPNKTYTHTSVDDFLYAYGNGDKNNYRILDGKDYYFSSVEITQWDTGYNPWEDRKDTPETAGDTKIYAWYADGSDWEYVATVPWNAKEMTYTFTKENLKRQPWRVKAVHNTVNYRTECDIDVEVVIRHNSPKMEELLAKNPSHIQIENISGVSGQVCNGNGVPEGGYIQDQKDQDNYHEPELRQRTLDLYGFIMMRNNAMYDTTMLTPHAESHKTAETWNDPMTGRVNLVYNLTALDGYQVYGDGAVTNLKASGKKSPGRKEVVFYDLLPYGVKYDPSVPVTAGRITNIYSENYKSGPGFWDKSQVEVIVDSEQDVIPDYRGTGRTMVRFHIRYSGSDPAVYSNELWMEGWGVSFGAYYDWDDIGLVKNGINVSAFMPEDSNEPLIGTDQEVARDDGVIVPSGFAKDYKDFGADIDGDGDTQERNVLYARAVASDDVTVASSSTIKKLVRADEDRFGTFEKDAVVTIGKGYTYEISVTNTSKALKDIVIFDVLEDAGNRRNDEEQGMQFEKESWHGTFASVDTTALDMLGIAPVIYYNENRDVALPAKEEDPKDHLNQAHGWYTKEEWEQAGKSEADVRAVAVDISSKTDGSEFVLGELETVSLQIHMMAPDRLQKPTYAYNNAAFYSKDQRSGTKQTVVGNSTRVMLDAHESLEIAKELRGEVPEVVQDSKFAFYLSREIEGEKRPFAAQEYELWKKDKNGVYQKKEGEVFATDGEGRLTLHAGEKAVFPDIPSASSIVVEEEENPFWEPEVSDTTEEGTGLRSLLFANAYRPVLYLEKVLTVTPKGNWSKEEFVFQVTANGEPLRNTEYWYVDRVRLDGGIPQKVTSLGVNGVGRTDEEGKITIHSGEIIAISPGKPGTHYKVTEVEGAGEGEDWICQEPSKEGDIPVNGAYEVIYNIYKWKDLYLTKTLTHQDPSECTQEFTFKITDEQGMPLNGNHWRLMKGDQELDRGTLFNGGLTCQAASGVVVIEHLEAGKTYVVKETESGELYEPQNGGSIEVTMPIYASKQEGEIINDYLLRPLSVTKQVVYDEQNRPDITEELKTKEFTMYVKRNGVSLADYPYTVMKEGSEVRQRETGADGSFKLKHKETAVFKDFGKQGTVFEVREEKDDTYHQIYPENGQALVDKIDREGSSVTIVNGTEGNLTLRKEYIPGEKDNGAGEAYIQSLKENPELRKEAAVTLRIRVTENGETYTWPRQDTQVRVIDQLDGTIEEEIWEAGRTFTVEPWKDVEINGIGAGAKYTLTESGKDQHRVYEMEDGRWVEISQKDPAEDGPVNGTPAENPKAVIYNGVTGLEFQGSEIHKRMVPGSNEVPEGAELVWRLERYENGRWDPAEGVAYLTADDAGPTCDRTLVTEEDGLIRLEKTASGYPVVRFLEEKVYLNRYTGMQEGDYRLVELPEESDPAWGYLAGYGYEAVEKGYGYDTPSEEAAAFVNANRNTPVDVKKQMTENSSPTDARFTMVLRQVLSTTADPVTKPEEIQESVPGAGIAYTVYEIESGSEVGSGRTTQKGEFQIRAGQYARFQLPDRTLWTVEEKVQAPYILKELAGTPADKMTKLSENLMLVNQKAEVIPVGMTVEVKKTEFMCGEPLTKDNFIVSVQKSDGSTERLPSDAFTVSLDTVPGEAGDFSVTVSWENYQTEVMLTAVATIELTEAMVSKGVIDAETGKAVVLNKGEVVIPERIIWNEKEYVVISIGEAAFFRTSITDVTIPDTVTRIGNGAFALCDSLAGPLELPEKITYIGDAAFEMCKNLQGELKLPEGLEYLGYASFHKCEKLVGDVVIPSKITIIRESAFSGCVGLNGRLVLPEGITKIELSAFYQCERLKGELKLPESLQTIETSAFAGTGFSGSLNLPKNLYSINFNAFSGCSGFSGNLIIPDTVKYLGGSAFSGCSGFNGTLYISESLEEIKTSTFEKCSGLKGTLKIPESVKKIGMSAFSGCEGFSGKLEVPGNVETIENYAFSDCRFTDILLAEGVRRVGAFTFFRNKAGGGTISIPSTLETIGGRAFDEPAVTYQSVNIAQPKGSIDILNAGILDAVANDESRIHWLG